MRRATPVLLLATAAALLAVSPVHALDLAQLPGPFAQPVHVSGPPGDSTRVLVVEKGGTIRLVKNGVRAATPYLDISAKVDTDNEEGLLSMAFPSADRFYVFYNEDVGTPEGSDIVVARFDVAPGGDSADVTSETEIIRIDHRMANNHNGGQLQIGPDGNLWISTGDGGGIRDSGGNAQNPDRLLGKLLRITPRADGDHDIPAGNPFATGGGAPQVWATGLRNPWRFSFDRGTGDLYVGDVGDGNMEEVDYAPADALGCGANFGWPYYEGDAILFAGARPSAHHEPLFVRRRSEGWRAIAGGYVIRDPALAEFGKYVHGDFYVGKLWLYDPATGTHIETDAAVTSLTGFGEDGVGRVYATSFGGGGRVDRLVADGTGANGIAEAPTQVTPPGCDPPPPPVPGREAEQTPPQDDPPQDQRPAGPVVDLPAIAPLPRAPRLFVAASRRQRAVRRRSVVLRARCDVACRATLTGHLSIGPRSLRLRTTTASLLTGRARVLSARLRPRALRVTRRALRRRARVRAHLTLRAAGPDGAAAVRRLTVTVVR